MACYTSDEVAKHNRTGDCWVIFKEKVYNVTSFLEDHPGGMEILVEHAGTDCTVAFEDVGHSASAYEMMKDFCIGDWVASKPTSSTQNQSTAEKCAKTCCEKEKSCTSSKSSSKAGNVPIVVAAVIIGAAVVYNFFLRK